MATHFMYRIHDAPFDYLRLSRHWFVLRVPETGLEIVELRPYGGGLDVLVDLVVKFAKPIPFAVPTLNFILRPVMRARLTRRICERLSETYPLGYCLIATKR